MSASKRKSYNSLDENLKNEGGDETNEMEMEEGIGQSKRKEEEKQIQNLLADTDHLIGKNKNHEADSDDLNEVQPIMNEKNVHNRPNDIVFCAPNSIWGFTPNAWRSIFTFVMPLLHVLFTTYVYTFCLSPTLPLFLLLLHSKIQIL